MPAETCCVREIRRPCMWNWVQIPAECCFNPNLRKSTSLRFSEPFNYTDFMSVFPPLSLTWTNEIYSWGRDCTKCHRGGIQIEFHSHSGIRTQFHRIGMHVKYDLLVSQPFWTAASFSHCTSNLLCARQACWFFLDYHDFWLFGLANITVANSNYTKKIMKENTENI